VAASIDDGMDSTTVAIAPSVPRLTLDLVADFVCPWSFLGIRRIHRALGSVQGLPLPLMRWHGFRLPTPGAGAATAWHAYLATRLPAGVTPVDAERSLTTAGRELGIGFAFDRIRKVPDTREAHRLTQLAAREGLQVLVADAIFRAYFEDGADIGDRDVLRGIGAAAGMQPVNLAAFADADSELAAVEAEEQRLRAWGVQSVPNLLLNGSVLVPGSADVDTYVQALDQALFPVAQSSSREANRLH
jgi:predicted DsbA family dithiol-disulfide isomerase